MRNLLFIKIRFSVLSPGGQRVAVLVAVESEERDAEAECVQHFVLNCGQQDVQLLSLGADRRRTEISMTSNRPENENI